MQKSKQPLTSKEFDEIFSRVARLTVELIINTDEGTVLTKRAIEPGIGLWHIPGGTVRFGETLHDAVNRVAYEELGIKVNIGEQIGWIEYPKLNAAGYRGWPIGIAFACTVKSGDLRGSEQAEEVKSFTEIPADMFPEQDVFLKKLI